jgi:hypothetical protein
MVNPAPMENPLPDKPTASNGRTPDENGREWPNGLKSASFVEDWRCRWRRILVGLLRRNRIFFCFFAVLVFCSVMVIQSYRARQVRHVELREALILLHARGYHADAQVLFERLLKDVGHLSDRNLLDDFQRTRVLVDPASTSQTNDPIWRYHWTISNELERREESTLVRARKLARDR